MGRKDVKVKVKASPSDEEHKDEESPDYTSDDEYPDPSSLSLKPTKDKKGRIVRQRPKTRTLVRWNETLDQQTLLGVQYHCNLAGIKIPWPAVAASLGPTITEGAIVQHLAKLRNKLEDAGVDVVPPLKRGGKAAIKDSKEKISKGISGKSALAKTVDKRKQKLATEEDDENDESEAEEEPKFSKRDLVAKRNRKGKNAGSEETDEDVESQVEEKPRHNKKAKVELENEKSAMKGKASPKVKIETDGVVEMKKLKKNEAQDDSSIDAEGEDDKAGTWYKHDSNMASYAELNDTQAVAVGAAFLAQVEPSHCSLSPSSNASMHKMVALKIGRPNAQMIEDWLEDANGNFSGGFSQTSGRVPLTSNLYHGNMDQNNASFVDSSLHSSGDHETMSFDQGSYTAAPNLFDLYPPAGPNRDMTRAEFEAANYVPTKQGYGKYAQHEVSNAAEFEKFQHPYDNDLTENFDNQMEVGNEHLHQSSSLSNSPYIQGYDNNDVQKYVQTHGALNSGAHGVPFGQRSRSRPSISNASIASPYRAEGRSEQSSAFASPYVATNSGNCIPSPYGNKGSVVGQAHIPGYGSRTGTTGAKGIKNDKASNLTQHIATSISPLAMKTVPSGHNALQDPIVINEEDPNDQLMETAFFEDPNFSMNTEGLMNWDFQDQFDNNFNGGL